LSAFPILAAAGYIASLATYPDAVRPDNSTGQMTQVQIDDLVSNGWETVTHAGINHSNWTSLSIEAVATQYEYNYNWLVGKGYTHGIHHHAFTTGATNDAINTLLSDTYGVKSGRISNSGVISNEVSDLFRLNVTVMGAGRTFNTHLKEPINSF
jgi:hypothetical protein